MNELSFNNRKQPVYSIEPSPGATKQTNGYMAAGTISVGLGIASTYGVRFNNPAGSGSNIYIDTIYLETTSLLTLLPATSIYKGGDWVSTTDVTPLTKVNAQIGSANSGIASIGMKGVTLGNPLTNLQLIETIPTTLSSYTAIYGGGLVLEPNSTISLTVAILAGLGITVNVQFSYWEINN